MAGSEQNQLYPGHRRAFPGNAADIADIGPEIQPSRDSPEATPPAKRKKRSKRRPDLIQGSEVRKIRSKGRTGYTADVPMTRLGGKIVSAESMLEADFALVTDAQDDDIIEMVSQPLVLEITIAGAKRLWTPDYLIKRKAGPRELVEVKPLAKIHPEDTAARLRARQRLEACEIAAWEAGYLFRLVTEQEIRIEPMLYNARLAHRHNGPFQDQALLLKAMLALAELGGTPSIAELGEAVGRPKAAMALALRLDRLGHIRLDRTARFSLSTRFGIPSAPTIKAP